MYVQISGSYASSDTSGETNDGDRRIKHSGLEGTIMALIDEIYYKILCWAKQLGHLDLVLRDTLGVGSDDTHSGKEDLGGSLVIGRVAVKERQRGLLGEEGHEGVGGSPAAAGQMLHVDGDQVEQLGRPQGVAGLPDGGVLRRLVAVNKNLLLLLNVITDQRRLKNRLVGRLSMHGVEAVSQDFRKIIKKVSCVTHVRMIGELALALLRRGPRMSDRGSWNPNSRLKILPTSARRFSPSLKLLTPRPLIITDLQMENISLYCKRNKNAYPMTLDLSCDRNFWAVHSWFPLTTLESSFWLSVRVCTWEARSARDIVMGVNFGFDSTLTIWEGFIIDLERDAIGSPKKDQNVTEDERTTHPEETGRRQEGEMKTEDHDIGYILKESNFFVLFNGLN